MNKFELFLIVFDFHFGTNDFIACSVAWFTNDSI